MAKLAELFESRFDVADADEDHGVSLVCTECSAEFEIPSATDMIGRPEMDYADEIIGFIERILAHLDECQPKGE